MSAVERDNERGGASEQERCCVNSCASRSVHMRVVVLLDGCTWTCVFASQMVLYL